MYRSVGIFILFIVGPFCVTPALAGAPQCYEHPSGPYCIYSGKVERAYINSDGFILLYFDTPLDLNEVASVGMSDVNVASAAMVRISDNEFFAKAFYSSILAAQSRGAIISIQMHDSISGYLLIDRIWVF